MPCPTCGQPMYVPGVMFFVDPFAGPAGPLCPTCHIPVVGGARMGFVPVRCPYDSDSDDSVVAGPARVVYPMSGGAAAAPGGGGGGFGGGGGRPRRRKLPAVCTYWMGGYCREGACCAFGHPMGPSLLAGALAAGGSPDSRRPRSAGSHGRGGSGGRGPPLAQTPSAEAMSKRMCLHFAAGRCKDHLNGTCRYTHSWDSLPHYWKHTDHPPASIRLHNAAKIKLVADLLEKTCDLTRIGVGHDLKVKMAHPYRMQLKAVYCIENRTMFERYAVTRKAVAETSPTPLPVSEVATKETWMALRHDCNERYLWHGTSQKTIDVIMKNSFDPRFATEGLFGAGVYFAEHCSKSDQYCTPHDGNPDTGDYHLVLARVIMGHSLRITKKEHASGNVMAKAKPGDPTPRVPPPVPGTTRPYDSVSAQYGRANYREFVVYDKHMAYPEFVVVYNRVPRL